MKILIFTVCFPPVVNGVTTRYAMTVQHLVRLGHEVTVATPVKNAPSEYYGAKVIIVPGFKFPLNEFCDSEYLNIYETYCIISKVRPDIVQVCTPTWIAWAADFWCWWFGIPVINSYHTHIPEYTKHYFTGILCTFLTWFTWFLVKLMLNFGDLLLVTSQVMGYELQDHGITVDTAVWRKGVNTELFHPNKKSHEIRCRLTPDPNKILLLYAGRISLEKGLPILGSVLADKRLKGKVHLALIGDGPLRKDLETKIFASVKNDVTFLGFQSQEELAYAYASSDIFIFPSETETLGLVAIEAMAGGLPVIGANARGMTATVKHGETGFLYPPGDGDQLVKYILTLVDHPDLRKAIATNARKDAEQWSWEMATTDLVDIYTETIEKYKAKRLKQD